MTVDSMEFEDFLYTNRKEPALSITVIWGDNNPKLTEWTPVKLKSFLEDSDALGKQKRYAKIMATKKQKEGPILSKRTCQNAFASKLQWVETEK